MYRRPSLITRLLTLAPIETAMSLLTGCFAVYGIFGYKEFVTKDLPFTPLIFAFGQWPFYAILLLTVGFGMAALIKADRA